MRAVKSPHVAGLFSTVAVFSPADPDGTSIDLLNPYAGCLGQLIQKPTPIARVFVWKPGDYNCLGLLNLWVGDDLLHSATDLLVGAGFGLGEFGLVKHCEPPFRLLYMRTVLEV